MAATNISDPMPNWTLIGRTTEPLPGNYQFTDAPQNSPQRFYGVRSP